MSRPTSRSREEDPLLRSSRPDILETLSEAPTVGEEEVRLLREVEGTLSPISLHDTSLDDENNRHLLPWWKRPSPIWMLLIAPFTALATASTMAPKVEIYTMLVCKVLKPEYFASTVLPNAVSIVGTGNAQCAADPSVQRAVASLQTVLIACQGVLSCLTGGAWGLYSDRKGRTRVLGISVCGILVNDFLFILVALCASSLPGNYWVLVIGPLIEGMFGGTPGGIAAVHAYVADTTDSATRSSVFSLALGLIFVGVSLGPTIGGLVIHFTQQTISIFYLTTIIHFIYALVMWFIIPESLSKSSMRRSAQKYNQVKLSIGTAWGPLYYAKKAVSFLSPLVVFAPTRIPGSQGKRARLDWRLFNMVVAYGCTQTLMASYSFTFQYAAATFGWSSETQGYWLSLVSGTRAVYLAVLLPFIIKLLKSAATRRLKDGSRSRSPSQRTQASSFDLGLSQTSLVFDMISFFLMSIFAHPIAFVVSSTISAFGAGFAPAIQALALDVYKQQGGTESGELFGAIGVVSAIASQVIGPFLYGSIYINTVVIFPRAIFLTAFAAMLTAFTLTCLVRVQMPRKPSTEEPLIDAEEETLLN